MSIEKDILPGILTNKRNVSISITNRFVRFHNKIFQWHQNQNPALTTFQSLNCPSEAGGRFQNLSKQIWFSKPWGRWKLWTPKDVDDKKHNDDKYHEVSDDDGNVDEGEDANNDGKDDDDQVHLVESSGSLTECPGPHRPSSGLEKRHIIWGLLCFATFCYNLLHFAIFC